MAIAFVNSGSTSANATSVSLTYSSTAHNCLVLAYISTINTLIPGSSVVDDAGNVWIRVFSNTTSAGKTIYVCLDAAAITSVSISGLTSSNHELLISEYSGVADFRLLTNTANATSTTASISSTLNAANNWLVAIGMHTGNTGDAFTATNGTIRVQQASTTALIRRDMIIDNTAATAISVTCSATLVSHPWAMIDIELIPVQNLNLVNFTVGFVNASQTSYTSESIRPVSGDLIIAMCQVTSVTPAAFGKMSYPLVTGCGLTFNVTGGVGASAITRRHWIVWAIADGSAFAGQLTFSFPNAPNNNFTWSIERVRGFDTTTPISWCVQIGMEATPVASIHDPTLTLNALQDANSLVYGAAFTANSNAGLQAGSGWTQTAATTGGATGINTLNLFAEFKVNDNVITWTNSQALSTQDMITGIEITASNTNASNNPLAAHLLGAIGGGK